jgi:phosphatidylinositol dimannoside acyltransferase
MNERLSYWAYAGAWRITKSIPSPIAYKIFQWIADLLYRRDSAPVKRLRSNYSRVHPELEGAPLEALVLEGMRSYLRYWCDTFRLPSWSREETLKTVIVENEELLRQPLAAGRGVIVSLPHAGNWDHAGAYFCVSGAPLVTVAEHLKPEKLFRKFLAYRERIGMEVLDANARTLGVLAQQLRNNRLVALVADRDLSRSGITVDFLGGPSRMPVGPALLSVQTGAPLITAFVKYELDGIRIIFEGEIPIPESGSQQEKISAMTQICADRFGRLIKENTADWHMLQRIWIDGDFVERNS